MHGLHIVFVLSKGTSTDKQHDLLGSPRDIDLRSNVGIGTTRSPFRYMFRHLSLEGTRWRAYELLSSKVQKVLAILATRLHWPFNTFETFHGS